MEIWSTTKFVKISLLEIREKMQHILQCAIGGGIGCLSVLRKASPMTSFADNSIFVNNTLDQGLRHMFSFASFAFWMRIILQNNFRFVNTFLHVAKLRKNS